MVAPVSFPGVRSFERLFIGGDWTAASSRAVVEVVSPSTEQVIATVPEVSEVDALTAVQQARAAFDAGAWARLPMSERAGYVSAIASALDEMRPELDYTLTAELGSPIGLSGFLNAFGIEAMHDMADLATRLPGGEVRSSAVGDVTVSREPAGVVLAIVPFNAPIGLAAMKVAAALLAGCTVVLKPDPLVPLTMFMLAEAVAKAGLPAGVVSVLPTGREVGVAMVASPLVDAVSFTGSTAVGRQIMSVCAQRIARVSLELGGKSAAIMLPDAEPEDIAAVLVPGGIGHSGQVCSAVTRWVLPRHRYDEWVDAITSVLSGVVVGDPFNPASTLGPLSSAQHRQRVEGYVRAGVAEGAKIAFGGGRPAGLDVGYYLEPTLFVDVDNSMTIAQEEIFGPVVCAIPYDDAADAVKIANDSPYGLAGSVFGRDLDRARAVGNQLRVGELAINAIGPCTTQSIGGFKQSGIGRDGGIEGIAWLQEVKQTRIG
jgi:acyl-CoA reductase-like NAD-dependent aldehyde dehydrogenase